MKNSGLGWVLVMVIGACGGDDGGYPPPGGDHIDADPPDARVDAVPPDAMVDAPIDARFDAPPDANVDATPPPDALVPLVGRVCVVSDLRRWTEGCSDTDAGGLTVRLGTSLTTTLADGSFTLIPPGGTNLRIRVSGDTIVSTVNPYDPAAATLWAVAPTRVHWEALQEASGIAVAPDHGSAMVHVTVDGGVTSLVTATSNPATPGPIHYSPVGTTVTWSEVSSDSNGKVLAPDFPAGPITITASRAPGTPQTIPLAIEPDSITFAYVDLPI